MNILKLTLILVGLLLPGLAFAIDGKEQLNGSVFFGEPQSEASTTYKTCSIRKTQTAYVGQQAVCIESVHCTVEQSGFQLNTFEKDIDLHCSTKPADGCRYWRWQDCMLDKSFNEKFAKCFTTGPGQSSVQGCPSDYTTNVPPEASGGVTR